MAPDIPDTATDEFVKGATTDYMKRLRAAWFDCSDKVSWNRDFWAKMSE